MGDSVIEALCNPFRTEAPHGPRSQGGRDEHYDAELDALLAIPSLSCAQSAVDERSPPLLRAVHAALNPDAAAYPEERRDAMFAEYLQDLREAYRSLHSPGKRPWPAFMQAAQDGVVAAQDCDAIFALSGIHCVGRNADGSVLIGDYLAGAPLDTPVLMGDGSLTVLERTLPPVKPIIASALRGGGLYRACHDTACRTRVQGAAGFRRMTRDELTSEVARRSAEITEARRLKASVF